jgi:hypothetical protein
MTTVPMLHLIPPFLAGKFISDAVMVMAGRYAAGSVSHMLHGMLRWESLVIAGAMLIITGGFLFVDWHALLVRKQIRFNFSIFK